MTRSRRLDSRGEEAVAGISTSRAGSGTRSLLGSESVLNTGVTCPASSALLHLETYMTYLETGK